MTVDDAEFGQIVVDTGDGLVRVSGPQIPTVELVNTGAARLRWIPIGTRVAADLRLQCDGQSVPVYPGPGKLTKQTYRVLIDPPSGPLLLTPSTPLSSRLVRGREDDKDAWLGDLTRDDDGTVAWTFPATIRTPQEAAVGYLLAAAFGTGAESTFGAMFTALERVFVT